MAQLEDIRDYINWSEHKVTRNFLTQLIELQSRMFESQFYSDDAERVKLSHQAQGIQEVFDLYDQLVNPGRDKE